jgi:hypothetical protein
MSPRKAGGEPNRGFARGLGLIQPAESGERFGAAGMSAGESGLDHNGAGIGALGGLMIAGSQHQIAEIAVGRGEFRIERDCAPAGLGGFAITGERHQDDGQVGMGVSITRLQGQSAADQGGAILAAAELVLDDAQMVEDERIARLGGRERLIGSARLG